MERLLLNSYVMLIIVSVLCMNYLFIDRLLVCLWLFGIVMVTIRARKNGEKLANRLKLYTLYQLPAIVASVVILYSKLRQMNNEWANGILEIWTHPFFSILELFPVNAKASLSSVYILACFVPYFLLLANIVVYLLVRPQTSNEVESI